MKRCSERRRPLGRSLHLIPFKVSSDSEVLCILCSLWIQGHECVQLCPSANVPWVTTVCQALGGGVNLSRATGPLSSGGEAVAET